MIMTAMILFAVADSFRTGVHKAMIFDYLKVNKWSQHKVSYYGHTRSWSQTGSAVSALIAAAIVYISGNYKMKARMDSLTRIFEKLGLSKERFRVEYVSAAEGVKFAAIMKEMTEQLEALGTEKIKTENKMVRPILDKMLARKKK